MIALLKKEMNYWSHLNMEEVAPYISTAEMVHKFLIRTREIELPQNISFSKDTFTSIQMRPKHTLTRPKEPKLETAQRVRAVRIKSSAELEEEMLAKLPKFKARPFNKKIFEASSLPILLRRTPQPPDFHEFHLKTMERANQHAQKAYVVSSADASSQSQCKSLELTEPRPPILETSLKGRPTKYEFFKLKQRKEVESYISTAEMVQKFQFRIREIELPQNRSFSKDTFTSIQMRSKLTLTRPKEPKLETAQRVRAVRIKSSAELEEEMLAKLPKFKARPFEKKILEASSLPPKPLPKQSTKPKAFHLDSLIRHEEEMNKMREERERMEREEAERRIFIAQPIMKEDPIPLQKRKRMPLTDVQEFVLHVDHRAVERSEFGKKIGLLI